MASVPCGELAERDTMTINWAGGSFLFDNERAVDYYKKFIITPRNGVFS
jgi:hypothetical protein